MYTWASWLSSVAHSGTDNSPTQTQSQNVYLIIKSMGKSWWHTGTHPQPLLEKWTASWQVSLRLNTPHRRRMRAVGGPEQTGGGNLASWENRVMERWAASRLLPGRARLHSEIAHWALWGHREVGYWQSWLGWILDAPAFKMRKVRIVPYLTISLAAADSHVVQSWPVRYKEKFLLRAFLPK